MLTVPLLLGGKSWGRAKQEQFDFNQAALEGLKKGKALIAPDAKIQE